MKQEIKYRIDVKLTGYEEVCVTAESEEAAREKALDHFWKIYPGAMDLRWKSMEATINSTEEA